MDFEIEEINMGTINKNNKRKNNKDGNSFRHKIRKSNDTIKEITLEMKYLSLSNVDDILNKINKIELNNSSDVIDTNVQNNENDLINTIHVYIVDEPTNAECNVFLKRGSPWSHKSSHRCNIIVYDLCIIHNKKQIFVSFEKPESNYTFKMMDNDMKLEYQKEIIREYMNINYF